MNHDTLKLTVKWILEDIEDIEVGEKYTVKYDYWSNKMIPAPDSHEAKKKEKLKEILAEVSKNYPEYVV